MIIAIFNPYYIVFRFKCIKELEKIYRIRQGSTGKIAILDGNNLLTNKTQQDLANQINIYF